MAVSAASCKGDSDPSDGNGGDGGNGGEGGDAGSAGGNGGGGNGGSDPDAGTAGMGGAAEEPDAMAWPEFAAEPAPMPLRDNEPDLTIKTTFPGKVDFSSADDLSKKFFVRKGEPQVVSEAGGALKVEKGRAALLVFDSEPDEQRSDVYQDFTVSLRYRSASAPAIWFAFAGDKNRNDGLQVSFRANKGDDGAPGTSDVDSFHFCSECWSGTITAPGTSRSEVSCEAGNQCVARKSEIYGWTYLESSDWVTVKLTVKAQMGGLPSLKARVDLYQGDVWVDGQSYSFQLLYRTAGEVSFGVTARKADVLVDFVELTAAENRPDEPLERAADGSVTMWLPEALRGKGTVQGVLGVDPGLDASGGGSALLFEHLRRFASAHGWALVHTSRSQSPARFLEGLASLAQSTQHPELTTVPIFTQSLLSPFPHEMHVDPSGAARLMGFFNDKLNRRINANDEAVPIDPSTEAGRKVPGFYTYSDNSLLANRPVIETFYGEGRKQGAVWALSNHNNQTHAVADSWVMFMPFLQELMVLRKPNNQGQLPDIDPTKGFLGENTGLLVGTKNAPNVVPYNDVPEAMRAAMSFLPGPETAAVYEAFHYYRPFIDPATNRVVIGPDGRRVFDAKKVFWKRAPAPGKAGDTRSLEVGFADGFNWTKAEIIEVYKGVNKRKELAPGAALQFDTGALAAGAHTFIVKAWDASGNLHVSHPVVAVIGP